MAILKGKINGQFQPVGMMGVGNASQSQRGLMTAQDKVKVDSIGNLSNLLTTAKDSIVNAINEIVGKLGVDWVVEEGTSGNWTYRKWNSGKAECYGIFTVNTVTADWSAWGSLFYCRKNVNIPLPFTFSIIKAVQISTKYPDAPFSAYDINNTTFLYVDFIRASTLNQNVIYNISIMGEWE